MDETTQARELKNISADLEICMARAHRVWTWSNKFLSKDHEEIKDHLRDLYAELLRINERIQEIIEP